MYHLWRVTDLCLSLLQAVWQVMLADPMPHHATLVQQGFIQVVAPFHPVHVHHALLATTPVAPVPQRLPTAAGKER